MTKVVTIRCDLGQGLVLECYGNNKDEETGWGWVEFEFYLGDKIVDVLPRMRVKYAALDGTEEVGKEIERVFGETESLSGWHGDLNAVTVNALRCGRYAWVHRKDKNFTGVEKVITIEVKDKPLHNR